MPHMPLKSPIDQQSGGRQAYAGHAGSCLLDFIAFKFAKFVKFDQMQVPDVNKG